MVKLNLIQFRRELEEQEARVIMPKMKVILNDKFKEEKEIFLRKFDEHPVTKELNAGPNAESSFVSTPRGGNLYSLLGFVNGIEPATDLRRDLEDGISKGHVTKQPTARTKLVYNLEVRMPTLGELKRRSQTLKWTTRSFIDVLESGIDNFSRYMFGEDRFSGRSRSGTAIQAKHDIRQEKIGRIEYISQLIRDFQNNLRNFNKKK